MSDTVYELWRDVKAFDEGPTYVDTYETREEAEQAEWDHAIGADLLTSDYEIREVTDP